MDLRKYSDCCPTRQLLIGFYNRDGVFTARYELNNYHSGSLPSLSGLYRLCARPFRFIIRNKELIRRCGTCEFGRASLNSPKVIIIIINIKDWTLWSVPSPKLQLLSPTFLRSSNCSSSLWSVVVWFQRDSVLWHSLQVLKPFPSVFIYLV